MKLIALDVGTKRIGVARADSSVRIAIPSGVVEVDGSELKQIASLARVYGTNFFVVGLPRNSKGEETAQSRYVREFIVRLKREIPDAKICLQDESLTSVIAEERLDQRHKKYNKGDIDAEAATIILQDFLENLQNRGSKTTTAPKAAKTPKDAQDKPKKHHVRNVLLSVAAVIVVALVGIFVFYRVSLLAVSPGVDCDNESESSDICTAKKFEVSEGESVQQIAEALKSANLIRNPLVFEAQYHLFYGGQPLQAGTYEFNQTWTMEEIIKQLIKGSTSNVFTITFVPGESLASIKQKLINQGYSADAVNAAFAKTYDHPVLADKPAEASLEGYIFGDTYEFYKDESVENIITTTLDALYQVVTENNLVAAYAAHGLNLYQGITLASIVQKEAKTADQSTVAQVFYRRLSEGMELGSDVTAQYAADLVDPDRTTYTDNTAILQIDSPYNTRLYTGLPYGPICNPGAAALIAAANPSDTNYLYFLTGDDGVMYYGYTEADHQQNITDHCQTLCQTTL